MGFFCFPNLPIHRLGQLKPLTVNLQLMHLEQCVQLCIIISRMNVWIPLMIGPVALSQPPFPWANWRQGGWERRGLSGLQGSEPQTSFPWKGPYCRGVKTGFSASAPLLPV